MVDIAGSLFFAIPPCSLGRTVSLAPMTTKVHLDAAFGSGTGRQDPAEPEPRKLAAAPLTPRRRRAHPA